MGYHLRYIPKGIVGELSKIEEEAAELADALSQGNKLMALHELSDMYGAMEAMLSRRFVGTSMSDLAVMARATRSAFLDGTRASPIPRITLQELRLRHTSIHFFGLGFIQIKLEAQERVHVYHPELPAFVDEPHDHRYDFQSTVLLGSMTNTLYEFVRSEENLDELYMIETSCTPVQATQQLRLPVQLVSKHVFHTMQGELYVMGRDQFHTIKTSPYCVTYLRRSPPCKEFARVIRQKDMPPICPFSQTISEAILWGYVEHALQSL